MNNTQKKLMMKSISKKLYSHYNSLGNDRPSMRSVARQLEKSPAWVHGVFHGNIMPSVGSLIQLCKLLKINLSEIITDV